MHANQFEQLRQVFKICLKVLLEKGLNANEIWVILDNWVIHRAQVVWKYWINTGMKLFYLPAYCPEFASIELYFIYVKAKPTKGIGLKIKLKADAFIEELSNCVHLIKRIIDFKDIEQLVVHDLS